MKKQQEEELEARKKEMMASLENDAAQRAEMEQKLADEKLAFEAKL